MTAFSASMSAILLPVIGGLPGYEKRIYRKNITGTSSSMLEIWSIRTVRSTKSTLQAEQGDEIAEPPAAQDAQPVAFQFEVPAEPARNHHRTVHPVHSRPHAQTFNPTSRS